MTASVRLNVQYRFCSDQCEELRAIVTKMNQDEICKERAQQLKLKAELKQREEEGAYSYSYANASSNVTKYRAAALRRNVGPGSAGQV